MTVHQEDCAAEGVRRRAFWRGVEGSVGILVTKTVREGIHVAS